MTYSDPVVELTIQAQRLIFSSYSVFATPEMAVFWVCWLHYDVFFVTLCLEFDGLFEPGFLFSPSLQVSQYFKIETFQEPSALLW